MKKRKVVISLVIAISFFTFGHIFAQEHNHSHKTNIDVENLDARKVIQVDKNNDGKIYQCPMHKDQVSDNAGKCPKCGMDMKEINIKAFANSNMKNGKMMRLKEIKENKDKIAEAENNVVREGVIDLKAIDKNGDGKVFQDMMDWNVISDSAGDCPVCGMHLKEVSIEEAKNNLIKNGFKVR